MGSDISRLMQTQLYSFFEARKLDPRPSQDPTAAPDQVWKNNTKLTFSWWFRGCLWQYFEWTIVFIFLIGFSYNTRLADIFWFVQKRSYTNFSEAGSWILDPHRTRLVSLNIAWFCRVNYVMNERFITTDGSITILDDSHPAKKWCYKFAGSHRHRNIIWAFSQCLEAGSRSGFTV